MTTDIRRLKFDIRELSSQIIHTLPESLFISTTDTFVDHEIAGGQMLSVVIDRLREYGHSGRNIKSRVFGVSAHPLELEYAIRTHNLIGNFYVGNLEDIRMKFDCAVGNPPYQADTDGNSRPIWQHFVHKNFAHLKEGGYLALIHPSGWRNTDGNFAEIKDLLLSKQMEYLEIHNENDGMQTFGAETRFDWYVLKNVDKEVDSTVVTFEDGVTAEIDLAELPFIPNHSYDRIRKLVALPGEEQVNLIHNSSYHHQREHVSATKTNKFKYPVIYTVTSEDVPTLKYSSINTNGHFEIAKLIWSNGRISSVGSFIDESGKFGMTQFAYAIADDVKVLPRIKKAFDSPEFRNLMEACSVGQLSINHRILATFRKDFWKEFV
jgi:hypothetical protein